MSLIGLTLIGCGHAENVATNNVALPIPSDEIANPTPSPSATPIPESTPIATPSPTPNIETPSQPSDDYGQPDNDDDEIETALACNDVQLIRHVKSHNVFEVIGNGHETKPLKLNQLYKHNTNEFKCVFSINDLGEIYQELTKNSKKS